MTDFVALRWPAADPLAGRHAEAVHSLLARASGWQTVVDRPGWMVAERPGPGQACTARMLDDGTAILIGRLFDTAATSAGAVRPASLAALTGLSAAARARHLTRSCWGDYVLVSIDPGDPTLLEMTRDPIGANDCVTWRCGAMRLVASRPDWPLIRAAPPSLAIDWKRVVDLLCHPATVTEETALAGIDAVPPGTHSRFHGTAVDRQTLWSPVDQAAASLVAAPPDSEALRRLVDGCVAAWCDGYARPIAELSGGLDSAIVASAMTGPGTTTGPGTAPLPGCFHYHTTDAIGDERRFARDVATRLGLALSEVARTMSHIGQADLDPLAAGVRPGLSATDFFHDADLSRRGAAQDADLLLTGQGGDALFFQMPTPWIAADLRRSRWSLGAQARTLLDIASWTRTPLPALLLLYLGLRRRPAIEPEPFTFLAPGLAAPPYRHAWLEGSAALPPAKRFQILGFANGRLAFGDTRCRRVMDVAHPLMSQPLVEFGLATPVLDLTQGRRDRAFARDAFAGRLPATLIERRGKGSLTPYYGRMIAASLPFLREWLLDGCLAQAKLLDRAALEAALDAEMLLQTDYYSALFTAATIESWCRVWQARTEALRETGRPPVAA